MRKKRGISGTSESRQFCIGVLCFQITVTRVVSPPQLLVPWSKWRKTSRWNVKEPFWFYHECITFVVNCVFAWFFRVALFRKGPVFLPHRIIRPVLWFLLREYHDLIGNFLLLNLRLGSPRSRRPTDAFISISWIVPKHPGGMFAVFVLQNPKLNKVVRIVSLLKFI